MRPNRVLIIGIDGGSWNVFEQMFEDGAMPFFRSLVERSNAGVLRSTLPPITPVAWASFQTGSNPGRHGVFGFANFNRDDRTTDLCSSYSLKVPTIWRHLSERGRTIVALNVPLTYPPTPVNGCMVSGLFTPSIEHTFTYPEELGPDLVSAVNYEIPKGGDRYRPCQDPLGTISYLKEMLRIRTDAASYLTDRFDWDLCMIHFQATDFFQHPFWRWLDRSHPDHREDRQGLVIDFYNELDRSLQEIVSSQQEGAAVVVVSDHGFRANDYVFNLNAWLNHEGYLGRGKRRGVAEPMARLAAGGLRLIRRLDKRKLRKAFLSLDRRRRIARPMTKLRSVRDGDWAHAPIYAGRTAVYGILYLLETREAARRALQEELASKLSELTDPRTGAHVIDRVFVKDEIYDGAMFDQAPDLIVKPAARYSISSLGSLTGPQLRQTDPASDRHLGTHSEEGIAVFCQESSRTTGAFEAHIEDIAPTVLRLLGEEVPPHMDGRVLPCALERASTRDRPGNRTEVPGIRGETSERETTADGREP